jgi:predicted nuclease of predicted toxin-antitoxin system
VKYLFDNCISFRYAEMLKALGVDAESLRQNFAQDIQDVALFKEISAGFRDR